jgi:hypothetical protein
MRREEEHFGEQELVLVYIAKRLNEAKKVETLFDAAGLDYLVEPDRYRGGVLFVRELVGAFFYVAEAAEAAARGALGSAGLKAYEPGG